VVCVILKLSLCFSDCVFIGSKLWFHVVVVMRLLALNKVVVPLLCVTDRVFAEKGVVVGPTLLIVLCLGFPPYRMVISALPLCFGNTSPVG
jgi:hypothetical protein